jgi:UDP-glucose 4-epimerase
LDYGDLEVQGGHAAQQKEVSRTTLTLISQLGKIKMLEYAVLMGRVKRFVYAGSGCSIYGLKEEFTSMHLNTPYQNSKMAGELYCNFYWHHYGLPIVKTRFFNSYGLGEIPGQYRNVIRNFIYWAMKGQPLPITGESKMIRDFCCSYAGIQQTAL